MFAYRPQAAAFRVSPNDRVDAASEQSDNCLEYLQMRITVLEKQARMPRRLIKRCVITSAVNHAHNIDGSDGSFVRVRNCLIEHDKRRFDQHARARPDFRSASAKTRLLHQELRLPLKTIEEPLGRQRLFQADLDINIADIGQRSGRPNEINGRCSEQRSVLTSLFAQFVEIHPHGITAGHAFVPKFPQAFGIGLAGSRLASQSRTASRTISLVVA